MRPLAILIFAVPLIATAQYRPDVPKAWNDEALQSMTVPAADGKVHAKYLPADAYYKLPERKIYLGYPVYAPNAEPQNYLNFLASQPPQDAFDLSKMNTEGDWNRGGEAVFNAPTGFDILTPEDIHDPGIWEKFQFQADALGALPGWRYVIRKAGKVEVATTLCGGCHERIIDRLTIAGAPGTPAVGVQTSFVAHRTLRKAKNFDVAAADWIKQQIALFSVPWLDPDPANALHRLTIADLLSAYEAVTPGDVARTGTSLAYPPKIPDLIGVKDRKYLGATGKYRNRGIEDLMRYAALEAGADENSQDRLSDAQLYALVTYINTRKAPPNPNRLEKLGKAGEKIFEREGCPTCHPAPLYTNDKLIPAAEIGTDPRLTLRTRKGTGSYRVPSLQRIWYREPLQHSGASPTLESWFDPIRERGGGEIQPVKGHPYGLKLSFEERQALLTFLSTL